LNRKVLAMMGALILVLVLIITFLPACATGGPGTETTSRKMEIKNPNTFIAAHISDVDSLDPAYAYDTASSTQIEAIYEPLIWYDGVSTSKFVPVLATEWTISEDGKSYRFKIRQGVKFHNGNDLTPEDVEYSFERGMVQDYGAGPQWMIFEPLFGSGTQTSRTDDGLILLDEIKSKVEVDGDWVQFNLVAPYEPFLQILTQTWACILDREWSIENGDWDGTQASYEALNDPPAGGSPLQSIANGTGPFKLERWDQGVEISLVRNENYWQGPTNIERYITKVVEEWTTRKLMLEAGDADWVYVPPAYVTELEGIEGLTVYDNLPQIQADGIFFQFDISPESTFIGSGKMDGQGIPADFFTDIHVRKGFAYAFDWETFIADALRGEAQQVASPVVEGLPYVNPDTPMYSKDLAKAEEHFKQAWGGEVWEKGFTLTMAYNAGNLSRKTACEILQQNLLSINEKFVVRIQAMQGSTMVRAMFSGLLPVFQHGWLADYPDPHALIFPFMHSNGTFSGWQNYHNDEVDTLIEKGISSASSAERQETYYQLQELYYEEIPSFTLMQPLGRRYFRDWIKGYIFNPVDPAQIGHIYNLSKGY